MTEQRTGEYVEDLRTNCKKKRTCTNPHLTIFIMNNQSVSVLIIFICYSHLILWLFNISNAMVADVSRGCNSAPRHNHFGVQIFTDS
jgi:hypothetical protein